MAAICKHAYYSGRVQGVGFRYTAQRLAQNYDLIGFVRNLPDGRVELVVEGEEMSVQAFLEAIGQEMGGYIRNTQVRDEPCSGRETSFRIAF